MRANPIRFTGMASGMDTDSIVKDLLRPQQYKIDSQKKAQALMQLKQDAWKDMNKKLFDFHTKYTDKMRLGSTFDKKIITSSNENAISIDSGATMPPGAHKFEIIDLATSASISGKIEDPLKTVGELIGHKDPEPPKDIDLNLGTVKWTDNEGIEHTKNLEITVNTGEPLVSVIEEIELALKDTGFTANFDATNKTLFINSTKVGASQEITLAATTDKDAKALLEGLGLSADKANVSIGKDAEYKYNDNDIIYTSTTNKIEVNGIKATLKAPTTGSITISSTPDTDATYAFVKEFVTEYNNLIDEINLKIGTKPGKDIEPLTAEERKGMSESEIKLWEDKLNSSLFYRDSQLEDFVGSARNVLAGETSQKYNPSTKDYSGEDLDFSYLADLGIVTGPWQERGKLHILGDEDDDLYSGQSNKLKAAIEANPQGVTDFLSTVGKKLYDTHNETFKSSNKLKSAMNFYNDKAMEDKVKDIGKRIDILQERMYRMETMHYAKFAAMEKMLSSLNSQGSWLSQQFGG